MLQNLRAFIFGCDKPFQVGPLTFFNYSPEKYRFGVKYSNANPSVQFKVLMKVCLELRRDVIDMHGDFCLVFTASPKWKAELRAKIGRYRNRCFA